MKTFDRHEINYSSFFRDQKTSIFPAWWYAFARYPLAMLAHFVDVPNQLGRKTDNQKR